MIKEKYVDLDKDAVRRLLLRKITEQWMSDNPKLVEDIERLTSEFVMFNSKWGTKLNPVDLLNNNNND